jgi:hypothetical protein
VRGPLADVLAAAAVPPEAVIDTDVEALDEIPLYRPPAPARRSYKPGTRQAEPTGADTGTPPWWASEDPRVWQQHTDRLKTKCSIDNRNIIGWRETGLSGGVSNGW